MPQSLSSSGRPAARSAAHSAGSTRVVNTATNTARVGTVGNTQIQSERRHWPKNTIPSHYSQEVPYVSDSTGPLHMSLRGSRPITFPKSGTNMPPTTSPSNPNSRPTQPHVFTHQTTRTPKEWIGDRRDTMRSTTRVSFAPKDSRSSRQVKPAGTGDNWSRALSSSGDWAPRTGDLATSLTPLEALAAARGADLLAAAQSLQRKAEAEQAAADQLFQRSCAARYERAVRQQSGGHDRSNTSMFFLDGDEATRLTPNTAKTISEKVRGFNTAASQSRVGADSLAGLGSRRYRSWDADSSLRLVNPSKQRLSENAYERTFERVLSNDSTSATMRTAESTTSSTLRRGLQVSEGSSSLNFVPHFLGKVDPSLHTNVRRNIFMNGNEFYDPITSSSKFKAHKFQPRAYNTIPVVANIQKSRTESTFFTPASAVVEERKDNSSNDNISNKPTSSFDSAPAPPLSTLMANNGSGSGPVGM